MPNKSVNYFLNENNKFVLSCCKITITSDCVDYLSKIETIYRESEWGALNGHLTYIIVLNYKNGRDAKASGVIIMCVAAWKGRVGGKKGTRERLIYGARTKFIRQSSFCGRLHIQRYIMSYYTLLCKVHRSVNVCSPPLCTMLILVDIILLYLWSLSTVFFFKKLIFSEFNIGIIMYGRILSKSLFILYIPMIADRW